MAILPSNAFAFTPLREFDTIPLSSPFKTISFRTWGEILLTPEKTGFLLKPAILDLSIPMKARFLRLLPLLLFTLTLAMAPLAFAQGTVQTRYNEGVLLYNAGKFGEALVVFEEVLALKPDFVYARNYSSKCKIMIAKGAGPKNDLEGKLTRLIVPEISFANATLGDVLDYLSARASEISGGSVVANFIYKGSPEQRQNTLITLSLRNVPLAEAIKYVGQLSQSKIKYEEHAIVVQPLQGGSPLSPPSDATAAPGGAPGKSAGEGGRITFE